MAATKKKGEELFQPSYLCDTFPRLYDLEKREHEARSGRIGGVLQGALCIGASGRGRRNQRRGAIAADGSREKREDISRSEGLASSAARWGEQHHVAHRSAVRKEETNGRKGSLRSAEEGEEEEEE